MEYNVILLLIVIIVCIVVVIFNIYLLINYQHPDDHNQAYFPKFVVVLGLSIAEISILMLPADVANRHACVNSVYTGACHFTLPMKQLWYAVYIIDVVLVFLVIPFSIFYYEGDQEKTALQRVKSAVVWCTLTAVIAALVLGILYGVVGYVDFTVQKLSSSTVNYPPDYTLLTADNPCFQASSSSTANPINLCAAYTAGSSFRTTWTMRTTFPQYVIALSTILGSIFFSIFGGAGLAVLPLSLIFAYLRRPKAIITRSQYIKEATDLGKRAKEIREVALQLQREERSGSKGRKWKKNVKKLQEELLYLEEDEAALEEVYPQGEKAETSWALTVLGYLLKLFLGLVGFVVSVAWIIHIIIYMLIQPPLSPFLNEVFIKLDNVWGLLGTVFFAFFCIYLVLCVIAGEMQLGLNFVFITIHPMKWNGTLMNSFLFNVGLILLTSVSVIQFCAKGFALYAQATSVQDIFGHTLESLRGLKYLFRFNIFQIAFIIFFFFTLFYYLAFGWKKKKLRGKFQVLA